MGFVRAMLSHGAVSIRRLHTVRPELVEGHVQEGGFDRPVLSQVEGLSPNGQNQ